ncbi:hypothetical protein [Pseudomonas sp. Z2-11]
MDFDNDAPMENGEHSEHLYEHDNLLESGDAPSPSIIDDQLCWSDLSRFEIFSANGGEHLYMNGFQQLKLFVVVKADDERGSAVGLSQAELDSIVLTDRSTNEPLTETVYTSHQEPGIWKYTRHHNRTYRSFPSNTAIKGSVDPGEFVSVKEFYVTTTANEPIVIRPRITRSDGKYFYADKATDFGSVQLTPVDVPLYGSSQYSLVSEEKRYYGELRDFTEIQAYELKLMEGPRQVKFVAECRMANQLQIGAESDRYAGYYAVGYFSGRNITNSLSLWQMPDNAVWDKEKLALVLVFARKGGDVTVREHIAVVELSARDIYGNPHSIKVRLSENPVAITLA